MPVLFWKLPQRGKSGKKREGIQISKQSLWRMLYLNPCISTFIEFNMFPLFTAALYSHCFFCSLNEWAQPWIRWETRTKLVQWTSANALFFAALGDQWVKSHSLSLHIRHLGGKSKCLLPNVEKNVNMPSQPVVVGILTFLQKEFSNKIHNKLF